MRSTFRMMFDEDHIIYYINNRNLCKEITKSQFIREYKENSFFSTDIYATENFFQLFSTFIHSEDVFENPSLTAYVKRTADISKPFYIGFNPLFFFIRYFSESEDAAAEDLFSSDEKIQQQIRKCCTSHLYAHTKQTDREYIAEHILESYKRKKWTFYGWICWNDILIKYPNFCAFVCRVFIHEMYHILFGHLDESIYNPKKFPNQQLMNIVEDFVINDSISWVYQSSSNIHSKNCFSKFFLQHTYHRFNNVFILEMMKYYLHYLMNHQNIPLSGNTKQIESYIDKIDEAVQKYSSITNEEEKTSHTYTLAKNIENNIYSSFLEDLGIFGHQPNSVDFYYRILDFAKKNGLLGDEFLQTNVLLDSHSHHTISANSETSQQNARENQSDHQSSDCSASEILNHILEKMAEENNTNKKQTPKCKVLEDLIKNKNIGYIKNKIESFLLYNVWKKKLRDFISNNGTDASTDGNISFKRENRRIPGLFVYNERNVSSYDFILVVDVSPSIGKKEYDDFVKEIKNLSRFFQLNRLRVIQFSSTVVFDKIINVSRIDTTEVKTQSSTDLKFVFDYLQKENNRKPIVVFTDGYFSPFNPLSYKYKHIVYVVESTDMPPNGQKNINVVDVLQSFNFNIISK